MVDGVLPAKLLTDLQLELQSLVTQLRSALTRLLTQGPVDNLERQVAHNHRPLPDTIKSSAIG